MLENSIFLKNKKFLLASSIVIIGFVLRLWNFHNLFYFAIDEEKAAYIIKGIITGEHFPSVGHPSSIGFRLGPLLYYLIAPFYKIFSANPITWGYVGITTSLLSMILIFHLGNKLGKYVGYYALILYNFSYLNILYDRRGWQLSFHTLIALTILYSLFQLAKKKEHYSYILTFALITASQFEVATLLFLPLTFITWIMLKIKVKKKTIFLCVLLFLISHAGLFIFDARHNFINTKYLINYFNPKAIERIAANIPLTGIREVYFANNLIPSTLTRTLFTFSQPNTAIQYASCPQYLQYKQNKIPPIFNYISIVILLYFTVITIHKWQINTDESILRKIILTYFLILFGGISIYTYGFHGEMAEFYLLSSFAYFFLVAAFILNSLSGSKKRFIILFLFLIFVYDNSKKLFESTNPYGFNNKLDAVNYSITIVKDAPFILDSFQTCWYSGGYRYLYTLLDKEPLRSYMDQYLSEYYTPDKSTKPEYQVTILTPELIGNNPAGFDEYQSLIQSKADYKKIFGAVEVYIQKIL